MKKIYTFIFKEGEIDEKSNMHFLHIANADRPTAFYSLDAILSVGYRVKSKQGTLFRQWANRVLKEYLLKGYAIHQLMNGHKRLKALYNPAHGNALGNETKTNKKRPERAK